MTRGDRRRVSRATPKVEAISEEELRQRISTATPHAAAWASPFSQVADGPLDPYIATRGDRALLVEPESGYWETVPRIVADKRAASIRERAHAMGVRPVDPATYDSDYYPLECVLYLTNKCNLACTYCYSTTARNADWRHFDDALLKKAIRMLFREERRQALCFLLFGGESLLAFPLMKQIVEYVHSVNRFYGKRVTFRMQTNGTLFTQEKIDFLRDNNIMVGLSMDGPEAVHDRNRATIGDRPSYATVMRGIELLQANGIPFSVISTVSRPDDMLAVFDYFIEAKITRRVKIGPTLPEGTAKNMAVDILEYARSWGQANLQAARTLMGHNRVSPFKIREDNIFAMITHLIRDHRPDICLRTPCGAAYGMIEFHPDGSLVTCDKTLYSEELGVVANLATIDENRSILDILDESPLIERIRNRTVETIPKCSHCAVKRHCGGSCTLGSYDFFKDFHREDVMCEYRRFMFEELMWLIDDDPANALLLAAPDSII